MGTIIKSVASYSPSEIVTSSDLLQEIKSDSKFGIPHNWIEKRIGIFERRFSDELRPSDLAIRACEEALANSEINPLDIDKVIFCGIDKDHEEPATACNVQNAIGAFNAHSFDISNACHGFIDAIYISNSLFVSGQAKTILICTGEQPSKITKEAIKKLNLPNASINQFKKYLGGFTCGDAGAAMLLQHEPNEKGFTKFNILTLPQFAPLCYYKKTPDGIEGAMIMDKICKAFLDAHEKMIKETLKNTCIDTIDYLITHQVGKRPHERFSRMTGIPLSKVPATYPKRGNITSATIPTVLTATLKKCNTSNKITNKITNYLFFGVGSGVTISQSVYMG